jgi:hypothetical protein
VSFAAVAILFLVSHVNSYAHFVNRYNAMLGSEFVVVGNLSTSVSSVTETAMDLSQIVEDLRRACTSTSYTYLYGVEVSNLCI